jgi:hypothetical protein|tara:strand:- start:332 stop:514 length:183 start_codon:yes stop_codon:yes gene_type:complete
MSFKSMGETMIEILTFIDELKELKPVIVSLDDSVEDTDTKINKLIKKYERIVNDNQQDQS